MAHSNPAGIDLHSLLQSTIDALPNLTKEDVLKSEDSCPICLQPFSALFSDSSGVTKLVTCNHIFCRKDLAQWINSRHGNCPTCRSTFLEIPSESDEESSDGGEYIPDEYEDEDYFVDEGSFSDYDEYDVTDDEDTWEDDSEFPDEDMIEFEEFEVTEREQLPRESPSREPSPESDEQPHDRDDVLQPEDHDQCSTKQ